MDKRMAGDFEIIQAFHIGDQEVVIGENPNASVEERYMCAYCQQNEIVALYNDVQVSDDFCEIAKVNFPFSKEVTISPACFSIHLRTFRSPKP